MCTEIILVTPSLEYASGIMAFRQELIEASSQDGSDSFAGCGSLRDCQTAGEWLEIKGYASQILKLNLQNCRKRNMDKVLITCSSTNIASEKTILVNGGVFEKEIFVCGEYIKRYWISLNTINWASV